MADGRAARLPAATWEGGRVPRSRGNGMAGQLDIADGSVLKSWLGDVVGGVRVPRRCNWESETRSMRSDARVSSTATVTSDYLGVFVTLTEVNPFDADFSFPVAVGAT